MKASPDISLVLVNANILTMDQRRPHAQAVAVAGERIVAVGDSSSVLNLSASQAQVIDCGGMTLLPGFNDAHCHILGLARRLQDLDCGPGLAPTISALQSLVRQRAESKGERGWVRGFGYDDRQLTEGRHPTRWDLDAAAGHNPVWLEHRSGHAAALNSLALQKAGIGLDTADPPGGLIERELSTGEPTGVLFEMRSFLRERLGNTRTPQDFEAGIRAAGNLVLSYGITSAQDAGADNGLERWRAFRSLQSDGALPCRITMFAGAGRLDELTAAGLSYGCGDSWLRLGHAKIMLTLTAGALHPPLGELYLLMSKAHRAGFPVAVHCIEEEAIAAAARVLQDCREPRLLDRIEHCAEGTPRMVEEVKGCGAAVVTQPGFVYHNGPSYRENVDGKLLPHLYPASGLKRAGVLVAFGSDTPVIDPNPWPALYSAVTRRASDGRPLSEDCPGQQEVSVAEALRMYTLAAAQVEGAAQDKGSITPGKLADMVLLDSNPLTAPADDLPQVQSVLTIVGGSVEWDGAQGRVNHPPL